jgi:hypothetical protein
MTTQKGSELNNVRETWDRNERNSGGKPEGSPSTDLDQTIKEEAAEYDNSTHESRILGGDRATVSDDDREDQADE